MKTTAERWGPWLAVVFHTLLVVGVMLLVREGLLKSHMDTGMLWNIFLVIDFPLGWLAIPIGKYLFPSLDRLWGFDYYIQNYEFACIFAILGGIQWFTLTKCLFWACRRYNQRAS